MTHTRKPPRSVERDGYSAMTLHRDGTATVWSPIRQRWERGIPSDADLAEMDRQDRGRVIRHLDRHGVA